MRNVMKRKDVGFIRLETLLFIMVVMLIAVIIVMMAKIDEAKKAPSVITTHPPPATPATPEAPPTPKHDMSVVVTRGNYSWIPINLNGNPNEHSSKILEVLDAFEKAHPDMEVVSWSVEKQQLTGSTTDYIFGIWIHHRKQVR